MGALSMTRTGAVLLALTVALSGCRGGKDDPADPRPDEVTTARVKPGVALSECPDDPVWRCGAIEVPVDRVRPDGRQMKLSFAVFRHTDDGSTATDALFATDGGPGVANIANRDSLTYIGGSLTDDRDLVVIDHRGTGQSGAVDCPRLQRIIGDIGVDPETLTRAVGACGRQLGPDADRYGSGDVAMDMEDVRKALGYDSIDLYGLSYGGVFLAAYATRYPEHLRAVVVDAGVPVSDPRHSWTWGMDLPPRLAEVVALDCVQFDPCASATSHAETALERLAAHVRRHPVVGRVDPSGTGPTRVVVDERELAALAWSDPNPYLFALAADALDAGDPQPLSDRHRDAGAHPERRHGLLGPDADHPRAAPHLSGRHLPRGARRISPGRGVERVRPGGRARVHPLARSAGRPVRLTGAQDSRSVSS